MKRITITANVDKNYMSMYGMEAGLSEEAALNFSYALYEFEVSLDVDEDGSAYIVAVDNVPLTTPILAN